MDVQASVMVISLEIRNERPSLNFGRGCLCSLNINTIYKGIYPFSLYSVQSQVLVMDVQASVIVISLEVRIERLSLKFGWGCLCSFYANTVWKAWIQFSLYSVQSQVILIFVQVGVMIISLETGNERPSSNFSWGWLCSSYAILWKNMKPFSLYSIQSPVLSFQAWCSQSCLPDITYSQITV